MFAREHCLSWMCSGMSTSLGNSSLSCVLMNNSCLTSEQDVCMRSQQALTVLGAILLERISSCNNKCNVFKGAS